MRARLASLLTSKSFRGVGNWLLLYVLRVDHDMFDALALPSVGHVHEVVTRLDNGGIRKFTRDIFERECGVPVFAIFRNGNGQRRPVACAWVVSQQVPAVLQRNGVDART